MSIIYAIIARDQDLILTDYSEYSGNFEQITLKLLKKTRPDSIASFTYNDEYKLYHLDLIFIL